MKPFARPYLRYLADAHIRHPRAVSTAYTPPQIAQAYQFPAGATGKGQTIGILELGGAFSQSDYDAYRKALGLPTSKVRVVFIGGAQMTPDPGGADGEVMLDVEVAGCVAPDAQVTLYFAPNTDQGFLAGVAQAIADDVDVISISWGSPEDNWSPGSMQAMDRAFQIAASKGIAVCVAAGDNGSSDGELRGDHVDFPAASPSALPCGGTRMYAQGSTIIQETVWNDGTQGGATGGGVSTFFNRPDYQATAGVPGSGRGVPDVAGNADPETGYAVLVNGQQTVIGGTSAVAPLWAGLIACLQQAVGCRVGGSLQPWLYTMGETVFNDTVSGNNGTYSARPGYDCCTGLGTPNGTKILAALQGFIKPPTQPTPPPAPTPTPTPAPVPVPQPPTGNPIMDPTALKELVDAIFTIAEQLLVSHPSIDDVVKLLHKLFDGLTAGQKVAVAQAMREHLFGLPPGTILKLLPVVLKVIETLLIAG